MNTEDQAPAEAQHTEPFRIDSRERAEWFLRKVAALDAEDAWVKQNAQEIADRLAKERQSLMDRFGADLRAWAEAELKDKKTKTLTLLNGKVAFRTVPERTGFESDQRDRTMEWARRNAPEAVLTTTMTTLDLGAVKAALLTACTLKDGAYIDNSTGEQLPFVAVYPEHQSFSVKTGGG